MTYHPDGHYWDHYLGALSLCQVAAIHLKTGRRFHLDGFVQESRNSIASLGYLCNIGAEPTTNCNSNETYIILFQIQPCITY